MFYCAVTAVSAVTVPIYFNYPFLLCFLLLVGLLLKKYPFKQILLLLIIFILFCLHSFFWDRSNISRLTGEETNLQITFSSSPEINGDRLSGFAELSESEKVWVTYRIDNEEEANELKRMTLTGKTFRVTGNLDAPIHSTVENGFDFVTYLRFNRAHWIMEIEDIEEFGEETGNPFVKLAQMREREIKRIDRVYIGTTGSFTKALIFGEQSDIPEEMYNQFKKLGIVHILALSGMQVGLIAAMLMHIFLRIGLTRSQTYFLLVCLLPLYAVITGMSASIIRACMMATIYMFGRFIGIRLSAFKTITICLLGYILIDPFQVFQIGFQLSFLLSYGLIISVKILHKSPQSPVVSLLVITAICQLISTPIILYYFYEISLISFLSNLLYVPLFTYVLFPATIIGYLLVIFEFFSSQSLKLLDFIYKLVEDSTAFMADFPVATLLFGKPSTFVMVGIVLCFLTMLIQVEVRSKRLFSVAIITCLLLGYQYNYQRFSRNGEITFIDVGQGDSTLILMPHNQGTYLIDTGGATFFTSEKWAMQSSKFDPGKDIILPFLKSKGVKTIDKLILTHADQDHVGGAPVILKELKVGEILIPFEQRNEFRETEVIKVASKLNIPVKEVQAGMYWSAGDAKFAVLSPVEKVEDKNESSIVIKATINQLDWLLVGDLGESGEIKLLQNEIDLTADILKVGHHGSRNSSTEEFIRAINPKVAIISSGRENRFGHPHEEVIDLLRNEDIKIFRTDLDGSIQYKYQNEKDGTLFTQSP